MNKIDLTRIDLNLLTVFEVLMEERHVSRAAERLGRTQSTVSHALGRLRVQLRDPLLVRVGGTMRPSPMAHELAEEVRPILRSIRRALAPRAAFDPATSDRVFRIALADFWSFAVARLLAQTGPAAPAIGLAWSALRETSLLDLADQQLDLVVAPSALSRPEGLRDAPVGELAWRCFMRRGHPAVASWGKAAWQRHGHVVVALGDRMLSPVQAASGRIQLERRVAVQVPSFAAVAPLLAESDLIATLPGPVLGEGAGQHGLMALDPPFRIEPIRHSVYWSARMDSDPAIRWLLGGLLPRLAEASHRQVPKATPGRPPPTLWRSGPTPGAPTTRPR
jgi:DNA-binding transcriptional LysR family regulator